MAVSIAIETPLQDDVRRLVARLNEHLLPLSPLEFQFKMTVEQMAEPGTTLFVARDEDGKAVGMGALKVHSAELGEVKRMFTDPQVRGKAHRIGAARRHRRVGAGKGSAGADARNRHRPRHGRGAPALYAQRICCARAVPRLSRERVVSVLRAAAQGGRSGVTLVVPPAIAALLDHEPT